MLSDTQQNVSNVTYRNRSKKSKLTIKHSYSSYSFAKLKISLHPNKETDHQRINQIDKEATHERHYDKCLWARTVESYPLNSLYG